MHTIIEQSFVGLLYEDGVYTRTLGAGKHSLKRHPFDTVQRTVTLVDMRERSLVLKGQEILTRDKVAVRVSILVYFRVVRAEAAVHEVADHEARIYEDVQLAARRFLGGRDLEAILSDRNEVSDAVREAVKDVALGYGVEIRRADVKDLVFPGNLRDIMNQVLETERKAEAKLIQAQKEIEAELLRSRAAHDAALLRLRAEREQLSVELDSEQARADAQRKQQRAQLALEVEEAELAARHPELLRLRELQALAAMARAGGKFVIGSHDGSISALLHEPR